MAMYLVTCFCIAHRRYIECLTSLKNWGHLIYGLVGVWVCSQAYYFAMSLSECLSCSDCLVVNGRLTSRTGPEQITTQTPVKLPSTPCTRWYRGVFSILCYLLKNRLTEPESCIYQVFTSLTVTSKSSYFSISCN